VIETYPASEALWRLTVPPISAGANSDNFRVNGTRYTVLHLHIQLGECVTLKIKMAANAINNHNHIDHIKYLKECRIRIEGEKERLLSKAQASWTSLTAACSTMFLTRNLLMALS